MKRSPLLLPLSREHHQALKLAQACERAVQSASAEQIAQACRRALHQFTQELVPHFRGEEHTLLPRLGNDSELVQRTLSDHRELSALCDGLQRQDAAALLQFAKLLHAHVRFEERELFPAFERLQG